MRSLFAGLTVLVGSALAAHAADEKYKSKEGKFTVQFPGAASVKTETKKVDGHPIQRTQAQSGLRTYWVSQGALPADKKFASSESIINETQDTVVEQNGKVAKSRNFTYGKEKYPGRELLLQKDEVKTKVRIYLVGARLYVVGVTGPKDYANSDEAGKFLDSFEVTK